MKHLQRQVANAFVLYANYKHYHWQTFGPFFWDLHLMFDEFATDVLGTVDELAERIRMIGQDVQNAQLKQMQGGRQLAFNSDGPLCAGDDRRGGCQSARDHQGPARAAKAAHESNDPGTVYLFSRVVQIHEKHEWFLREILKKRDGLVG